MNTGYLKSEAKKSLQNSWGTFAAGAFIYLTLNFIVQISTLFSDLNTFLIQVGHEFDIEVPEVLYTIGNVFENSPFTAMSGIFNLAVLPVLHFGFVSMSYKIINGVKIKTTNIFDGFKNFGNVFILGLLETLYTILWSLLFIIPGIIKAYSYSMAYYIMAENPGIKPSAALKESEKLMDGYKMDYFLLELSFFGWHLLDFCTLGILNIWLTPYIKTTTAAFYERVKIEKFGDDAPYIYKNLQNENEYAPYLQNLPYPNQQSYSHDFNSDTDGNPVYTPTEQAIPESSTAVNPTDIQQSESDTDINQ